MGDVFFDLLAIVNKILLLSFLLMFHQLLPNLLLLIYLSTFPDFKKKKEDQIQIHTVVFTAVILPLTDNRGYSVIGPKLVG